jgi:uncharacterized protein
VLVDANVLLYAVDESSPFHLSSLTWLEAALNGTRRVGIPWSSLHAFVRIASNPRASSSPLTAAEAWAIVELWIDAPVVWTPVPGRSHRKILGNLVRDPDLRANLASDAALAALCIEYGLQIVSADSDFARFSAIGWINPIALH